MSSLTTDRAAGAMLGLACGDVLGAQASGRTTDGWSDAVAAVLPILRAAAAGEDLPQGPRVDGGPDVLLAAAPVALASAASTGTGGLVRAATRVAPPSRVDPVAAEAAVLWSGAIRHAIRAGALDLRAQLALLPEPRRARWTAVIDAAEQPGGVLPDGVLPDDVEGRVGAAWRAIASTPVPEARAGAHLRLALETAAGSGPAVAAAAGALLGARWGASAIPAAWRRALHGAADLARDAVLAVHGGLGDGTGWPAVERVRPFGPRVLVPHPHDPDVLLGSLAALDDLPAEVDAVVSLCRVGRRQTDRAQIDFVLVDQPGRNPNLDLVLRDAADTVAALRAEGRRVLVHCAEGRSRTPSVGALYSALHLGVPAAAALDEVTAALPDGSPAPFLQEAVLRIAAEAAADRPRPVLYVDLDTAMADLGSGVARLPPKARADYRGRYDEAPGLFPLMDPFPGAVEAFTRLAEVYDAYLLAAPPWGGPAAWQHRVDWVQLHFGAEEEGNPAYRRLVLADPANLDRGAVLVGGDDAAGADRFAGERIRLGAPPTEDWDAVLALLLDPQRLRGRPGGAVGRSRDRVVGRPSLTAWVLEALRARGGSASVVQVARDVWAAHEDELRRSGDLLYTWQHDLRRVASALRDEGRLAPSADGVWRLAR